LKNRKEGEVYLKVATTLGVELDRTDLVRYVEEEHKKYKMKRPIRERKRQSKELRQDKQLEIIIFVLVESLSARVLDCKPARLEREPGSQHWEGAATQGF
jgi:hypothetical protein